LTLFHVKRGGRKGGGRHLVSLENAKEIGARQGRREGFDKSDRVWRNPQDHKGVSLQWGTIVSVIWGKLEPKPIEWCAENLRKEKR
jgi:hypothetical protein